MKFTLINETVQQNCINHLLHVPLDGKTEVVFIKAKTKRTSPQNNTCHMWLSDIAKETGECDKVLKRNIKDALGFYEVFTDKDGDKCKEFKSSADFTVEEMMKYMNAIMEMANFMNITLRDPNFYGYEV